MNPLGFRTLDESSRGPATQNFFLVSYLFNCSAENLKSRLLLVRADLPLKIPGGYRASSRRTNLNGRLQIQAAAWKSDRRLANLDFRPVFGVEAWKFRDASRIPDFPTEKSDRWPDFPNIWPESPDAGLLCRPPPWKSGFRSLGLDGIPKGRTPF